MSDAPETPETSPKGESNAAKAAGELKDAVVDAADAITDVPFDVVASVATATQKVADSAKQAKNTIAGFLKGF